MTQHPIPCSSKDKYSYFKNDCPGALVHSPAESKSWLPAKPKKEWKFLSYSHVSFQAANTLAECMYECTMNETSHLGRFPFVQPSRPKRAGSGQF